MTKRTLVLFIALLILLTACNAGEINNGDLSVNNGQITDNEGNTEDDVVYEPIASAATCVASAEPLDVQLESFDHVKGAVEDYKITIVEYGDYQ